MLIYLLSFASGKRYVGQTQRSLAVRISQHRRMVKYGSLLPVHCAWRRHGEPEITVLCESANIQSLHDAETAFIEKLRTLSPHGYNVGLGGETAPSKSPEVAAKIADKATGRGHRSDVKEQIKASMKERWNDPEYRKRVLEGVAASFTPARRAQMAEITRKRMKGKPKSEEHKAKLRERLFSQETRHKMSVAAKGRKKAPRSDATRQKMAENTRAAWLDPELKARRVAAMRAGHARRKAAKSSIAQ